MLNASTSVTHETIFHSAADILASINSKTKQTSIDSDQPQMFDFFFFRLVYYMRFFFSS
jgi:exonuclease I